MPYFCFSAFARSVLLSCFLTMVLALSGLAPVHAEQQNVNRIGDDYLVLKLNPGTQWQTCQKQCAKDDRCAAWTFLKERKIKVEALHLDFGGIHLGLGKDRYRIVNPQCRLKYAVPQGMKSPCCISGVKHVVHKNKDRKEQRCTKYAERSLNQYDRNLELKCGLNSGDWHHDYSRHYKYCMKTRQRKRRILLDERADELKACKVRIAKITKRCNKYASRSVEDFNENQRLNCGFGHANWAPNGLWNAQKVQHFQKCAADRHSRTSTWEETRGKVLSACRIASRQCDDFASRAVKHQRRNKRLGCKFTGGVWDRNKAEHHRLCMITPAWKRDFELAYRRATINRCRNR